MMWHTHAAFGAGTAWLYPSSLESGDAGFVSVLTVFCIVGALTLMPDRDAVESKIQHLKVLDVKPLFPVAIVVNCNFGHRGTLHSLWHYLVWSTISVFRDGKKVGRATPLKKLLSNLPRSHQRGKLVFYARKV
jgi:membrane-bound metal-dependent hydrolase YbcI (DUF457 family)